MAARPLELPTRVDLRPEAHRPELKAIVEPDEPTIRIYQSQVLQKLDRAPNLASRVESQEHIRVEMLNALVRANRGQPLAYAPTVPFEPFVIPAPAPAQVQTVAPWSDTHSHSQSGIRRRPTFRRRSNAPLLAIFVAFAIFFGLLAQHRGTLTRARAKAQVTRLARQHAANHGHHHARRR